MDFTPFLKALAERGDVLSLVVAGLVALGALYFRRRSEGASDEPPDLTDIDAGVTRLSGRLNQVESRLERLEADVEHLPTREEFHKMEIAMTRLDGRMETIDQRTSATGRAVGRIEDFLLKISGQSNGG